MLTSATAPRKVFIACALVPIFLVLGRGVHAATFSTLYSFTGPPGDGGNPLSSLVADKAGNLYGTTAVGGSTDVCSGYQPVGCGTVFRLAPDGSETVLHAFSGQPDGAYPHAGLVADRNGNLFGTTSSGGASNKGAVFEIAADGTEHVVYSFGGKRGVDPEAALIIDGSGNLYGTTAYGGDRNCPERIVPSGCGVVFRIVPDGTETVLHAFADGGEGNEPLGGLVMDQSGNLYGMTQLGGNGLGNVFEIAADGTETVLYTFGGAPDGARPAGSLVIDSAGNLFGTTGFGGNSCQFSIFGCGVVFKLEPNGTETVLHAFNQGCCDGFVPIAGLVEDGKGNLYGTTFFGGKGDFRGGVVFKVTPGGKETVLHGFSGRDSFEPDDSLLLRNGYLYGTASAGYRCGRNGNSQCGSVFKVQK